jgi:carboxypeptidase C (cathepsin A)
LGIFLDRHSRLKKNDLYIAASGYGAVFATHLSRAIINRNKDESLIFWSKINLKGILLGNPCVNPDECFASGSERNSMYHYDFLYTRGFITKRTYY